VDEVRKILAGLKPAERAAVVAELFERGEFAVAREVAQLSDLIPVAA